MRTKLLECKTLDAFINLIETLDPTIGKLGGRSFTTNDKKQSYTMNQIIYQFTKIVKAAHPQKRDILKGCESIRKLDEAALFESLADPKNKAISRSQRSLTKIRQLIGNFVFSILHHRFDRKMEINALKTPVPIVDNLVVSMQKTYIDKHGLLQGNKEMETPHFAWLLNLGLLRVAEESAQTEEEKQQIRFLAANFLNKSAPIQLKTWKPFFEKIDPTYAEMFDELYQVGAYDEYWYHRESLRSKMDFGQEHNKRLALGINTPFILTDSIEFDHFYPLQFTVLNENPALNVATIEKELEKIFIQDPEKALSENLTLPFLIDVTHTLGKKIKTEGDQDKEMEFSENLKVFQALLDETIEEATQKLVKKFPAYATKQAEVKKFIQKNMTCVSRVEMGDAKGIKIIPVDSSVVSEETFKSSHFLEFMHITGIYLGAISLRRKVLDAFARREDVTYAIAAKNKSQLTALYYPRKEDFTNAVFFQRLLTLCDRADAKAKASSESVGHAVETKVDATKTTETKTLGIASDAFEGRVNDLATKPHIIVLGKATMHLLKGLMEEIDLTTWDKINQNPALCQIFQLSLMMIREHLASAEMHAMANNYAQFAQEIELVHAEIATLLELARPFKESDFAEIYKQLVLPTVPVEFQSHWKGGLGKASMNIFAGINAAVLTQNDSGQTVHDKNVYFESLAQLGKTNEFEDLKKNPDGPKINLYLAQFNPNVNVDPTLTEYKCEDVIENVRYLLQNDRATKHLTVTVDCTIEKTPSANVKAFLEAFKKEIAEGKMNVVIFNSGQKYDMLGMDNYYGAPFYLVNNGGEQWKAFDTLLTHPIHQTDALSHQWFCLSKKYAADSLDQYKELIFKNTRYVLDHMPKELLPNPTETKRIKVNKAEGKMNVAFIDIKMTGKNYVDKSYKMMELFYKFMFKAGIKVYSRQSFGFFHPCYLVFDLPPELKASTSRLTLGLNPEENDVILQFMQALAKQAKD